MYLMHSLRLGVAVSIAFAAALLLAGCESGVATTTPKASQPTTYPDVSAMMKSDEASPNQKDAYTQALATLSAHCQEGAPIAFSIDANAIAGKTTRLKIMQTVATAIGNKKGINCTTAALDAAAGTPFEVNTPTADPTMYLLGDVSTTQTPAPDCSLAVANWTAAMGPVDVSVMSLQGPITVTVLVTLASMATETQIAQIPVGPHTHIFQFKDVTPSKVAKVQVTATTNDFGIGGSCIATGSPTA